MTKQYSKLILASVEELNNCVSGETTGASREEIEKMVRGFEEKQRIEE